MLSRQEFSRRRSSRPRDFVSSRRRLRTDNLKLMLSELRECSRSQRESPEIRIARKSS